MTTGFCINSPLNGSLCQLLCLVHLVEQLLPERFHLRLILEALAGKYVILIA